MSEQHPTNAAAVPSRTASVLARAAILAAAFALPAGAAERWFTVEIIVFEDLRSDNLHAEHWPPDPGEPSLVNAIELTPLLGDAPDGGVHAYRLMKSSNLTLGKSGTASGARRTTARSCMRGGACLVFRAARRARCMSAGVSTTARPGPRKGSAPGVPRCTAR